MRFYKNSPIRVTVALKSKSEKRVTVCEIFAEFMHLKFKSETENSDIILLTEYLNPRTRT
jgi:hypothetical protein